MSELPLLFEVRDGIARITFNRPAVRNAISPELACRLADAFTEVADNADIRVAILTGAGDSAFCSGGDLELALPLLTGTRQPETEWDHRFLDDPLVSQRAALREFDLDKPVIAAINGTCMAGGLETVIGTDIRIAAEHATFALPEVRRGLIPFAGSLVRLPRQIPHAMAMELLLTGEPIDAAIALRAGLVNRVVPADRLMEEAWRIATRIGENGPVAVRAIKRTVMESSGRTLKEGFALEDAAKAEVMASEDAKEGPRAFIEKRRPRYRGK